MHKKICALIMLLGLIAAVTALSKNLGSKAEAKMAIGVQGSLNFLNSAYGGGGVALSFKPPTLPIMFGLGYNLATPAYIGVTADWWLWRQHLFTIVHLYLGPGLGVILGGPAGFDFVVRVPIGLQLFVLKPVELFVEFAPAVNFLPSPALNLQGAFGVRFWF